MAQDFAAKFTEVINLDEYDDQEIKRAVLDSTIQQYEKSLAAFDRFLELHPSACSPPNIKTYKGFLEFYAKSIKGRIEEKPVVQTIEDFRRIFETSMARYRGFSVPKSMSITMKEFIISDLKRKLDLPDEGRDREGLSPNDLTILLTQLWCRDFKEYRGEYPDRTRVQNTASILIYCFSSARTGEVHESTARRSVARKKQKAGEDANPSEVNLRAKVMAACYKHFKLTVELVDGIPMLVLTYARLFVKAGWRKKKWKLPIHAFYEVYKEEIPLFFNLILFILPLFSADRAFRDYTSVAEILDDVDNIKLNTLQTQEDHCIFSIPLRKDMDNVPVFRPTSELSQEASTGKARGADAFGKEFAALGYRSGYRRNVTARACRRWALMEADKRYTETARMKFASHINPRTFGESYAHPVCEVDGPATYLNIASREGHIQNQRSMIIHRNPNLWQSLPAKAEFEFEEREDVIALNAEIELLTVRIKNAEDTEYERDLRLQRRRVQSQKDKLYYGELKEQRESQQRQEVGSVYEQTLFHYRRRAMPERDLLAKILPIKASLRSSTGREAILALEAICRQHHPVAFRSGLQPVDGRCICGKTINELFAHRRWLHLYRCYQKNLRQLGTDDFAEFCFECDKWFNSCDDWREHCQDHLNQPDDLLRCDPIIWRNCPVKPGYCPFCLGDPTLAPYQRMEQYLDTSKWYDHVQSHVNHRSLTGLFHCRHPACTQRFESLMKLSYHLEDIHCFKPPRGKKRAWEE